jgi:hypothetical protein
MEKATPMDTQSTTNSPARYKILVKSSLNPEWSFWFEGFTITPERDDITALTGEVADQAALHGIIAKIQSLGLTLISIGAVEPPRGTD